MNFLGKIIHKEVTLADQETALKLPYFAYMFAKYTEEADIEKCQEVACRVPHIAYYFAIDIPGADLLKIRELCPDISDKIDKLIMERVLR